MFLEDVLPHVMLASLPKGDYGKAAEAGMVYELDFDDAYQCTVAKHFGFKLVTMDRHAEEIEVVFM